MSITSDEVNFLVYRYLQENGFLHNKRNLGEEICSYFVFS